jgi:hypothetical protein
MAEHRLIELDKKKLLFVGGYGSGKTEVAVNFASYLAKYGYLPLSIVDLDIVNPYFRSREAVMPLTVLGVKVISPAGEQGTADLPIIVPQVKGAVESDEQRVVLDVGGDDVGARVVSSLAGSFPADDYEMLMVLNKNRPFTSDLQSSVRMLKQIEAASRLRFTGLVSNTHLIDETTPETVLDGLKLAREVGRETGLEVRFVSAKEDVLKRIDPEDLDCPVLPLERFMLKPWEVNKKAEQK